MRRSLVPVLIVITILFFIGCAKTAIKSTISDFEDAINDESASDLKETLSPDSDFIVSDPTAAEFLDYFQSSSYIPVNYSTLDIDVGGGDADVFSDVNYNGLPAEAKFWMRREGWFLSSDWRVYRYYDDIVDITEPIWRKPQN